MEKLEKLEKARALITEVENELLEEKGSCPYEIGYTIRNLDEAIAYFKRVLSE